MGKGWWRNSSSWGWKKKRSSWGGGGGVGWRGQYHDWYDDELNDSLYLAEAGRLLGLGR